MKGFIPKNLVYVLLFALLLTLNIFPQNQWQPLNSGVSVYLRDVSFVSDNVGWVVGHNGTILSTTDDGITWVQQS